ncbi:hypothetical protein FIBSPDRAFT_924326 [Athelia psychrophila]|uniref:Uncharacterized protein n=1 Tax=Athelia psychrophila TaxID=1759441 RepID=A0A166WPN4_9AGAM|nr:hypothetical protein FIBSPDRAFT_924326 [Fibularhizoctonia sp. CBS 109695]
MPAHPDCNSQYRTSPHAEDPKEKELVELSIQLEREHASAASAMRTKHAEIAALKTKHALVLRELTEQQAQTQQEATEAAATQESVERAHNSRNYTEDLMKDYEDETRDARAAAKTADAAARVAEEAARVAKSELRAVRKERDHYIARYGVHTDPQAGADLATSADTGSDRGVKRKREVDDIDDANTIDEQRHIKSKLRKALRLILRDHLCDP